MSYNLIREWALRYAALGWPVAPMQRNYRRGVRAPSTDPATIRRWWNTWPGSSIALTTGARSGLFVLEVEDLERGLASLAELERRLGPLPATLTAIRGTGAPQFYFAHPGVHVLNGACIAPGLVVRGDGGYVIAPPSKFLGWPENAWAQGTALSRAAPAKAPGWLIEFVMCRRRWPLAQPVAPDTAEAGEVRP